VPDLEANVAYWDEGFHWRRGGDEWSDWWGDPARQWRATVQPRIEAFLPVERLLEIAPGYGRWTQFLRNHCDELVGIDLSPGCVDACRRRFERDSRASFHVNDGRSLAAAGDGTIDFVFSFDSLVHVDRDVMEAYVAELGRVLGPRGVAFVHHSNMAAYGVEGVGPHWRSASVSADSVAGSATEAGLNCFRQELVPWGDDHPFLNDCFTWLTRPGSPHDRPREVIESRDFMSEARRARESLTV
jgi:SAM-dependent methyltransferase